MPGAALRALASHHLRRSPVRTALLVALVGLVSAVPMSLLSAGRHGELAVDRFQAFSDPPELVVNVCPPGVDPAEEGVEPCAVGVDLRADARRISELQHVRAAVPAGFVIAQGGADPDPATWGPPLVGYATSGPDATAVGRPVVLRGRVAAPGAAGELVLGEALARRLRLDVGDQIHLAAPGGTDPVASTVVGVVRTLDDLLPVDAAVSPGFHVREGWTDAHGDEVLVYRSVIAQVEAGRDGVVAASLQEAFPGRYVNSEPFLAADQLRVARDAIGFESRALSAIGLLSALGALAVVAQVVLRQARHEASELAAVRALGATDRFLVGTAVLRWAPVALASVVVAAAATALAATLGPFGVAGRAPWPSGPRLDVPVALAGAVLLVGCVLASAALAVRSRPVAGRSVRTTFGPGVVPRVATTFLGQSLRRSGGSVLTAVLASAVALAALGTATAVAASLDRVVDEPRRFGAPFDALVPAVSGVDSVGGSDGVVAATVYVGGDMRIGDEDVWIQAAGEIEGLAQVPPVVLEGRAPATEGEIALAPLTLDGLGLALGDPVEIQTAEGGLASFDVVGVAPITDGYEPNVGYGGLVTVDGLGRLDRAALTNSGDIAVQVTDGPGREAALQALVDIHPQAYVPFPVPASLGNARRVTALPVLIALGGAVVALATFVHALLLATRIRRQDLAVLRVLGLVRRQSFVVVTTMAGALGLLAAGLGVFFGLMGGVWGWDLAARTFGVDPEVVLPLPALAGAAAGLVAVTVLAAVWPARRASTLGPAQALRTD